MLPPAKTATPPSDAILERLLRLHPKVIDLSLGRVERLLARLGHPERDLPPVVHVAGTNGKGSVIANLRALLETAGQKVHVYTSPHLVRFHERIRLAGSLIPEPELADLLAECERANSGAPITYFEITTAAALLAFARHPADALLLEVGLGGRLDATNVIPKPRLSVITPVSIDHTQFLGETLAEIAFEKAGILKPGVPAVIAAQDPVALAVIEKQAAAVGAPLSRAGREWRGEPSEDEKGWTFERGVEATQLPPPVLPGRHQIGNAATALACAAELGLDPALRAEGLGKAVWPGRLQKLTRGKLRDLLPETWELWLDGGHNAAAAEALAAFATASRDRPLHIVYGMLRTKAVQDYLRLLAPAATTLTAVPIPGESAALSAQEAGQAARDLGFAVREATDSTTALQCLSGAPARVLICGSLYLAGRVLAENGTPPV